MKKPPQPLTAVLKTAKLEIVEERELPLEQFPDMIELPEPWAKVDGILTATLRAPRQFFRIGITDRRAFYREGTSYRISQ